MRTVFGVLGKLIEVELGREWCYMKVTEVKKRLWLMGWSQDSLVRRTGRSKSEISMVLNGYRRTATVQEAIAAAVGVTVEELFREWAYLRQKEEVKYPGGNHRP